MKEPSRESILCNTIAREMFRDTADQNYVTARWCFLNGLNIDFYWLSLHAIEKYLKTILLLNGQPAKGFGHDIVSLYEAILPISDGLLPKRFSSPSSIEIHWWHDEEVKDFVRRLYDEGNPDNRYQIYGYRRRSDDLFKVDQIVFSLRRICWPLDTYIVSLKGKSDIPTFREVIKSDPTFWTFGSGDSSPLFQIYDGKYGAEAKSKFLDLNFAFAPDDFVHSEFREQTGTKNPVLLRYIHDPLKSGPDRAQEEANAIRAWVKNNIKLSTSIKKEIDSW